MTRYMSGTTPRYMSEATPRVNYDNKPITTTVYPQRENSHEYKSSTKDRELEKLTSVVLGEATRHD